MALRAGSFARISCASLPSAFTTHTPSLRRGTRSASRRARRSVARSSAIPHLAGYGSSTGEPPSISTMAQPSVLEHDARSVGRDRRRRRAHAHVVRYAGLGSIRMEDVEVLLELLPARDQQLGAVARPAEELGPSRHAERGRTSSPRSSRTRVEATSSATLGPSVVSEGPFGSTAQRPGLVVEIVRPHGDVGSPFT